mgnify:CR=1 FL=1
MWPTFCIHDRGFQFGQRVRYIHYGGIWDISDSFRQVMIYFLRSRASLIPRKMVLSMACHFITGVVETHGVKWNTDKHPLQPLYSNKLYLVTTLHILSHS